MSNGKPTPGPWKAGNPHLAGVVQINDAKGRAIAQAWDWPEAEANARLIAAAPDLLAALEALSSNPHLHLGDLVYAVREKEGEGWDGPAVTAWSEAVMAAKAAIAKARGE